MVERSNRSGGAHLILSKSFQYYESFSYNQIMNQAPILFSLQTKETEIDAANKRLDEIAAILANDKAVQKAESYYKDSQNNARLAHSKLRSIEETEKDTRIKIETSNQSLYSGKIRNPKELQDIQAEIQSLQKRLTSIEDEHLESLLEAEAADSQESKAAEALQAARNHSLTQNSMLAAEQNELNTKLSRLNIEKTAILGSLNQTSIDTYNKLKIDKKGRAVSKIEDSACSLCGVGIRPAELQQAKFNNALVFCASCGRILFA